MPPRVCSPCAYGGKATDIQRKSVASRTASLILLVMSFPWGEITPHWLLATVAWLTSRVLTWLRLLQPFNREEGISTSSGRETNSFDHADQVFLFFLWGAEEGVARSAGLFPPELVVQIKAWARHSACYLNLKAEESSKLIEERYECATNLWVDLPWVGSGPLTDPARDRRAS
jgi:hypothetical protein